MRTEDEGLWLAAFDRTGFALEYQMQWILREHGWNVINSRYYVDDKTGAEREIDIVAYKKRLTGHVICYTYLMVSCKKSAKSSWVFLTSDISDAGEDFEPCPLGIAASAPGIDKLLSAEKPLAASLLMELDPYRNICSTPHKVLSFQQIHRESHKPEDDKQIFASIIATIIPGLSNLRWNPTRSFPGSEAWSMVGPAADCRYRRARPSSMYQMR